MEIDSNYEFPVGSKVRKLPDGYTGHTSGSRYNIPSTVGIVTESGKGFLRVKYSTDDYPNSYDGKGETPPLAPQCFEYYKEETKPNSVWSLTSTDESELKGDKTIVMCIEGWDMAIIVHELNHVIYHLAKYCHLETNYDSQEWISYMLEHLFEQCQNDGSFKPYDI